MSKGTVPGVSVVMPAYNAEKYLREAIDSILAQTYTDFELIIINDGSTDSTKEVIHSYSDPRIIYIENERNSGICITLNKDWMLQEGVISFVWILMIFLYRSVLKFRYDIWMPTLISEHPALI